MANSDLGAYNKSDIQAIADAIRHKNGSEELYKVSEMAQAITDIQAGGYFSFIPRNDGKTHIFFELTNSGRSIKTNMALKVRAIPSYDEQGQVIDIKYGSVGTIDWGDGTSTELQTSNTGTESGFKGYTFDHIYETAGVKEITISHESGYHDYILIGNSDSPQYMIYLNGPSYGSNTKKHMVKAIEMAHNVTDSVGYRTSSPFQGMMALENFIFQSGCKVCRCTKLFSECYNLKNVDFRNINSDVELNLWQIFYSCYSIKTIILPNHVTYKDLTSESNKGDAFSYCYCLENLVLPSNCNSYNIVYAKDFNILYNLKSLTIPETVTDIYNNSNGLLYKTPIEELYLRSSIPPVMHDYGIKDDGKKYLLSIFIPRGSLEAYSEAAFWSTLTSYFVEYDPE